MRRVRCLVVVVALLCACVHGRTPTSPQDFQYAREVRELFQAISDLEHIDGGAHDAGLLQSAFEVACENYDVSCERATWQEPWATRGDAGKDLAHAIASIDRVYAVWIRNPDGRNGKAVGAIAEARRDMRELLFARAHGGKKPAHGDAMIAAEELRYARGLIEDSPQGPALDKQIASLDAHWPDKAARIAIDPEDFADLYFAGRLFIARDAVDHALEAIRRDRAYREEHGSGPLSDAEGRLGDVRDALAKQAEAAAKT
jgi:hypothetical protein